LTLKTTPSFRRSCKRINSDELFFWDAGEAMAFASQLRSCEAIKGRKKLPWRYRWPDAVRYEVAQGLHGKGAKKQSTAPAAGGKRRGRPPKATQPADSEQIGLAL
jgi:hypothetical protein